MSGMFVDDRIAQGVLDGLEDLKLRTPQTTLDKELVAMLRAKLYAENDIPVEECPLDDPTLEELHFLVTCLQREALQRRRNVVCQADTDIQTPTSVRSILSETFGS